MGGDLILEQTNIYQSYVTNEQVRTHVLTVGR